MTSNTNTRLRAERTVVAERRTNEFRNILPTEDTILQRLKTITDRSGNNYILLDKIGQGARGTVYKAVDTSSSRYVAIKLLKDDLCSDQESLELFFHEFKILKGLTHKNIVYSLEDGKLDGKPFFIMEYMNGQDLSELLSRTGPLPWQYVFNLMMQACSGIEVTHSINVVHRDIKLGNLFLVDGSNDEKSLRLPREFVSDLIEQSLKESITLDADTEEEFLAQINLPIIKSDQILKIIDYGFAIDKNKAAEQSNIIIGTPQYMAPELFNGGYATFQTDIYSLGVVIFKLLTGRAPIDIPAPHRVSPISEILEFRKLHDLNLPLPPYPEYISAPNDVRAVLQSALAKNPLKRYKNISQLKDEIELCLQFSNLGW